jgi:hypothetical protein
MARLAYTSILIALVATCASAQAQQQRGSSAAQIMSSIPGNSDHYGAPEYWETRAGM